MCGRIDFGFSSDDNLLSATTCRWSSRSDACTVGRITLTCNGSEVPMLIGLAVDEAPHIKPGRSVRLARGARIRALTHDGNGHIVAFSNNGDNFRRPAVLIG